MTYEDDIWQAWIASLPQAFPLLWKDLLSHNRTDDDSDNPAVGLLAMLSANRREGLKWLLSSCRDPSERRSVKNSWHNCLHRHKHQKTSISVTRDTKMALEKVQQELSLSSLNEAIEELLPFGEPLQMRSLTSMDRPDDDAAVEQLKKRLTPAEHHLVTQLLAWSYKLGNKNRTATDAGDERLKRFKQSAVFRVWKLSDSRIDLI